MALPEFTMRQLLEAGCHFGHQSHRWNPKMGPFIFGTRNKIHIMDLAQTVPLLHQALKTVSDTVAGGGRVLFVGTKRQASDIISDAAKRSAQYYVNARWLGGMLTNWNTISNSIKRLRKVDEILATNEASQLTKKERLTLTRERDKLERALGGIKDMGGTPDLLFVIDTNKEAIAIQEAKRLNIPVVAVLDSNCNPDEITHPIPGNDDASRSINLYCDLVAKAALDGIARQQGNLGVDLGASENPIEAVLEESAAPVAEVIEAPVAKEIEPPVVEAPVAEVVEPPVAEVVEAPAAEVVEAPAAEVVEAPEVEVVEAPEVEKPVAEVVSEQPVSESSEEGALFETPSGEPDDLKKISGIGPVLEGKLHSLGITKFAQVAAFTAPEIEKVDTRLNFKGKIERDGWIAQAKGFSAQ
ncbi:MAG: 30S ribosomal protein S2 [Hyphomicrobiales bacterium]|nr:30S ribosomal protein S2 [Hyphomicrobiales bacterium]